MWSVLEVLLAESGWCFRDDWVYLRLFMGARAQLVRCRFVYLRSMPLELE